MSCIPRRTNSCQNSVSCRQKAIVSSSIKEVSAHLTFSLADPSYVSNAAPDATPYVPNAAPDAALSSIGEQSELSSIVVAGNEDLSRSRQCGPVDLLDEAACRELFRIDEWS